MGQVVRGRRRRWPFVLLALLVAFGAVLVGADYGTRYITQNAIAADVQKATHSEGASARVQSEPFLYDILAKGRVDHIVIVDRGVPAGLVRIDQIRLDASEVRFDRNRLFSDRSVRITAVGRATLSVVIKLSGLEGTIASDLRLQVTATGSDRIVVSAAGRTLDVINLTRIPIVPVCPVQVHEAGGTVAPVPASVLAALSKGHKAA